jgi:hypothetical protein
MSDDEACALHEFEALARRLVLMYGLRFDSIEFAWSDDDDEEPRVVDMRAVLSTREND